MADDFRNTEYCPAMGNIEDKKRTVAEAIIKDHPLARDMHAYISNNRKKYKKLFICAYNGKCAYCGVNISLIPKDSFEIDHFIYEKDPRFSSKADAGYIDNLVLACHKCNHSKRGLSLPDESHAYLHPDKPGITDTFIRDENFYIIKSEQKANDPATSLFYSQLHLGAEFHRLDFLLMNMKGLQQEVDGNASIHKQLSEAIELIQIKRNLMAY